MNDHFRQGIQWVLDNCTSYQVSKDLGISNRTVNRYQNGTSDISKMELGTAEVLYNYYLGELSKMDRVELLSLRFPVKSRYFFVALYFLNIVNTPLI